MVQAEDAQNERIIDVREIHPRVRHTVILQLIEHLQADQALVLVVDHDPLRLKLQLDVAYAGKLGWQYLQRGPDRWRVRITRTDRV